MKIPIISIIIIISFTLSCKKIFSDKHEKIPSTFTTEKTSITPHLEKKIEPNKNIIWCATLQLAWNELCSKIGEDLHFYDEPGFVSFLNKKKFQKKDIDEGSIFIKSGWKSEFNLDIIKKEINEKFKTEADTQLLDYIKNLSNESFITYVYLLKLLNFKYPFILDKAKGLRFDKDYVESFGISEDAHNKDSEKIKEQISVIDYINDDHFIIELKTESTEDRLILAKIKPHKTLNSMLKYLTNRINKAKPSEFRSMDTLSIPVIQFNIKYDFPELQKQIKSKNEIFNKSLLNIFQRVYFSLNEKGVKLESESLFDAKSEQAEQPRLFIFDKPFIIIMKRKISSNPYFALWIGNTELMKKIEK